MEKIKILVVDDSDIIRNALRNFFEDYNIEVITCNDGLEGIQRTTEHKPNLIFLDLMMPNLDGIKMLQVIKVLEETKKIPVIVISANTARTHVLAALESGADRVISKPLQKEIIIKYVNEVLGSDFLSRSRKTSTFSEKDTKDVKNYLLKFFISSFPTKKKIILDALNSRNLDLLKTVIHEIKGAGGTIGYPQITLIAAEIEKKTLGNVMDWAFVESKCQQLFSIIDGIPKENPNKG